LRERERERERGGREDRKRNERIEGEREGRGGRACLRERERERGGERGREGERSRV